jgi:hypothetical protein
MNLSRSEICMSLAQTVVAIIQEIVKLSRMPQNTNGLCNTVFFIIMCLDKSKILPTLCILPAIRLSVIIAWAFRVRGIHRHIPESLMQSLYPLLQSRRFRWSPRKAAGCNITVTESENLGAAVRTRLRPKLTRDPEPPRENDVTSSIMEPSLRLHNLNHLRYYYTCKVAKLILS